jgi:hypothetical protein
MYSGVLEGRNLLKHPMYMDKLGPYWISEKPRNKNPITNPQNAWTSVDEFLIVNKGKK